MLHVPWELVTDILSRVAVKALLRFRSVSKVWLALIDNPDFIKLHLNHSILTNSHRNLIVRDMYPLYSLELDSLHNPIQLNHPLKLDQFLTTIMGSCNGIICLKNSDKDIGFWNPSTQTHHKLPPLIQFPYPNLSSYSLFGFGYDYLNEDYKVLRILQFYNSLPNGLCQSQAMVYSFKSNSWLRVSDFPHDLRFKLDSGIFANGALHWLVCTTTYSEKCDLIGAFDLGTGKYCNVPQPYWEDTCFHDLGVLGGCLCVVSSFYFECLNFWVMKDYGVKESWTKLISIAQPNANGVTSFEVVLPMAYSKSGEQVLLLYNYKRFVWYDLKRKKDKILKIGGLRDFYNANVFVESLVKLPDGVGRTDMMNLQSVEKRKNNKKKNKQVLLRFRY